MKCYAAIETPDAPGTHRLVPARRHVFHASKAAAERALGRIAGRCSKGLRGFIWPSSSPNALREGRFEEIYTVAL